MAKLNIEIRKTLSAENPFAVYIDGQSHGEFPEYHDALAYIRKTTLTTSFDKPIKAIVDQVQINDLTALKSLDVIAFNQSAEDRFVDLVSTYLHEEGPQPVNAIIAEASYELDISPATAKRYLLKHSARRATFVVQEKLVRLRKPLPSPTGRGAGGEGK
jgi:hypothetical protein